MKKSFALLCVLATALLLSAGCSRTQKVVVHPGDLTTAYEPLGTIQVEQTVPRFRLMRCFRSQPEYLKGLLDKKMVKIAKARYGAEVVIKPEYWPDLASKKFPQGKVYAKGEMVRYKRFAS
jgi:hypothetical protein